MSFPDRREVSTRAFRIAAVILLTFMGATFLARSRGSESRVSTNTTAANALEDVTETVTLNSPILRTWQTDSTYIDFAEPCDSVSKLPHQDAPDGQIIVGYVHDGHMYFKYLKTITCTEEKATYFRGAVWFDLTPITSKAPAPRVFVTKATLNFRKIDSVAKDNVGRVLRDCRDEVLIGTGDWLKGEYEASNPPGADPIPVACAPATVIGGTLVADCSLDVRSTVNNWVAARQDNFGFVFKGENERTAKDAGFQNKEACQTRYGAFSLTVTYKYEKSGPVIYVPPPAQTPVILVAPGVLGSRKNVALVSNGGVASSSSNFNNDVIHFTAAGANDGDRKALNWGKGGGWSDDTPPNTFPDWLQIDFADKKTINEIDVFTIQDNSATPSDPVEGMTFNLYGLTAFEVQYWNGSAWITVPGGNITGNKLVWRKVVFTPVNTSRIRILTHGSADGFSRLAEVEAWTP